MGDPQRGKPEEQGPEFVDSPDNEPGDQSPPEVVTDEERDKPASPS